MRDRKSSNGSQRMNNMMHASQTSIQHITTHGMNFNGRTRQASGHSSKASISVNQFNLSSSIGTKRPPSQSSKNSGKTGKPPSAGRKNAANPLAKSMHHPKGALNKSMFS